MCKQLKKAYLNCSQISNYTGILNATKSSKPNLFQKLNDILLNFLTNGLIK